MGQHKSYSCLTAAWRSVRPKPTHIKTHPHYIKLTTQSSGPEKCIYLSFETFTDYSKWLKKCRKVSSCINYQFSSTH